LRREIEKLAPGDPVTLRVYSNGRYRDVRLTAGSATELRGEMLRITVPSPAVRGRVETRGRPGAM
jgi:DUF971 family protein